MPNQLATFPTCLAFLNENGQNETSDFIIGKVWDGVDGKGDVATQMYKSTVDCNNFSMHINPYGGSNNGLTDGSYFDLQFYNSDNQGAYARYDMYVQQNSFQGQFLVEFPFDENPPTLYFNAGHNEGNVYFNVYLDKDAPIIYFANDIKGSWFKVGLNEYLPEIDLNNGEGGFFNVGVKKDQMYQELNGGDGSYFKVDIAQGALSYYLNDGAYFDIRLKDSYIQFEDQDGNEMYLDLTELKSQEKYLYIIELDACEDGEKKKIQVIGTDPYDPE